MNTEQNQITEIQNWKIETHGEEPRVLDLVLAEKLGVEEPRMIRRLIKKMIADNRLERGVYVRSRGELTSMPNGGTRNKEVDEFWLTEEEALLVTTQSRTPKAKEILKEVVRVFVAYRRGQLAPVSLPSSQTENAQIASIAASVAQLAGVVGQLVAFVHTQAQPQAPALPSSQPSRPQPPTQQRALPLRPPADDQSRWYWPSEIAYRLGISVGDVWHHARELQIDGSIYQRNQRQSNNKIGAQFHQWAANEIARRVNQLRR